MKKIFFILRLMSGFRSSFEKGIWEPQGSPTIYKLIEGLEKEEIIKEYYFIDDENLNKKKVSFKNINLEVNVIKKIFFLEKLNFYINSIIYFVAISLRIFKSKPDLIYVDRGNIFIAGLISRFLRCKVVLRIMGIPPPLQNLNRQNGFFSSILRWAYKSKFKWVLFTEDGSNPKAWSEVNLRHDVDKDFWINGVDNPIHERLKKKNRIDILFVNRLTYGKGCMKLLKTIKKLSEKKLKKDWVMNIIGDGNKKEEMISFVKKHKLNDKVKFHGKVDHKKMYKFYNIGDIYVSLNSQGNISNSNLEALNYKLKCIFLGHSKKNIDVLTETLFSKVHFIKRDHIVKNLSSLLQKIINRNDLTDKSYAKLPNWNDRIKKEISKLKSL